jgi:hypothetical protein
MITSSCKGSCRPRNSFRVALHLAPPSNSWKGQTRSSRSDLHLPASTGSQRFFIAPAWIEQMPAQFPILKGRGSAAPLDVVEHYNPERTEKERKISVDPMGNFCLP